jgi:hypothetical protein
MVVTELKILNKKGEKNDNQFSDNSALILWHQIQVLVLLADTFSVSLFLLKVGMMYCAVMEAAPLFQTA